jgi:RluA family pseudouridine synthase
MKSTILTVSSSAGATLQDFLASKLGLSRNRAKSLLDNRAVLVNRRRVWMARHIVENGDVIEVVGSEQPDRAFVDIPVLLEDRDYLVVGKPAGILANGPDSAESLLRESRGEPSLRVTHRLDRDTSGCLLFARGDKAFENAVALFRERKVGKTYRTIVAGRMESARRDIAFPLDGLTARTRIRSISTNMEASYLEAIIETGRTHQIRRHLAMVGHPVLGDRQHGTRLAVSDRQMTIPRQMLHAYVLAFPNPSDGHILRAHAPLPNDFKECLARFRLSGKGEPGRGSEK